MRLPTRQDGVENRDKVYYKGSKNEIKNLTILNCIKNTKGNSYSSINFSLLMLTLTAGLLGLE